MAYHDSTSSPSTPDTAGAPTRTRANRLTALRDFCEMISGIFLDLRGDMADSFSEMVRPLRVSIRRMRSGRNV